MLSPNSNWQTTLIITRDVQTLPEVHICLKPVALQAGNIATAEMYRTFNMGVGMVLIVSASDVEEALAIDGNAFVLGSVVSGDEVQIV